MDTHYSLQDLIDRFGSYQQAVGRAQGTVDRYGYTFLLFGRFIEATGREPTVHILTTETMEAFAKWLRATPIKPQNGTSKRAESGIHSHLRDLRNNTSPVLLDNRARYRIDTSSVLFLA